MKSLETLTAKALTAYNKSELFRGADSSSVRASVKKAEGEYAMGMISGTELPPNGVDPKVWSEVSSAVEKLKSVQGIEHGYPMIVYRDSSGIYVHTSNVYYRLVSAKLEVETMDGNKDRFTLSFSR